MTTLDIQVAASADDAHERDDNANFSSTNLKVRCSARTAAVNRYNGGARFTGLTIPQGNTIDVAHITVVAGDTTQDDPNVQIHLEDVDDAADFSTSADVTNRTRTTAFTTWTATGIGTGEVNSPSIVGPVQEVVDRAGWASGNNMVVLIDGKDNNNDDFRAISYDNDTTKAIKLHIEYTAGAVEKTWPLKLVSGRVPVHQLGL